MSAETVEASVQRTLTHLSPLLQRSEADPRPVVLMTCGVAGAGKSTLAKAVLATHPSFIRLSIDAIIASKHGLYGQDYPPSAYQAYQDEADVIFLASLRRTLERDRGRDIILDRAFYAKDDRDEFKRIVESLGGRCVLVHLKVAREELWRRICERCVNGVDADSAREIDEELLRHFVEGFEEPRGEGEVVVE